MTPARSEELKLWLLRALLDPPPQHDAAIAGFDAEDWALIVEVAAPHRLRPLLNTIARSRWADQPLPDYVRAWWHRTYAKSFARQFERRALLLEITAEFDAAGIDYAVLKGGALLGGIYSDPAQRPVRDLDLLVRPAEVARASTLLIARCGCMPQSQLTGVQLEDYSIHKHAEPLWSPARETSIELHTRLVDKPRVGDGGLLFDPERLLARAVPRQLGSRPLMCLAWPETLLHLIAHAVHDHQFNNGPLLLTDTLAILRHAEVDWDEFWQLAEEGGWNGAARLTGDLLSWLTEDQELCFGDTPGEPVPEPVLRAAALLLLQDVVDDSGVSGWARLQARPSLKNVLGRLKLRWNDPSPSSGGAPAPSPFTKAAAMLKALANPASRSEVARSAAVYRWLGRQSDQS